MTNIIDEKMRSVFLNCLEIHKLERNFNYQNYGRYPYRERKNSVQIVADFNVNAYSVNGLFVEQNEYEIFYPPQIIEQVEQVVVDTVEIYQNLYPIAIDYISLGAPSSTVISSIEYAQELIGTYDIYETVITQELVEIESTVIQTMKYIFPFSCVDTAIGQVLSLG